MGRNRRTDPELGFSTSEIRAYAALALALAAIHLTASGLHLTSLFGFSQLRWWGVLAAAVAIGLIALLQRLPSGATARLDSRWALVIFSGGCGVTFFMFRNWFINPDGALFPMKFMVDVPTRGFHATHDEVWELYIHSKFWLWTNNHFGWSVAESYQVLSSAGGAVFVFLLLAWCQRVLPSHWALAFLGCVSGGYMQLFFGDVENYTLATAIVTGYFVASVRVIEGRTSVVYAAILLALALMFHLEAGFLLPSLVYLLWLGVQRGQGSRVLIAIAGFGLVVAGTLLFFDRAGLPIGDLFANSHAFGDGGHFREMLVTPDLDYYFQITNLSFLLVPSWLLLFALLSFRRIPLDPINVHLILASAGMTALVIGWKAQLGVYNDWNLFAMAAVPISLLVWRNVFRLTAGGRVPWPIVAMIAVCFAHSYSWVIGNHWR